MTMMNKTPLIPMYSPAVCVYTCGGGGGGLNFYFMGFAISPWVA